MEPIRYVEQPQALAGLSDGISLGTIALIAVAVFIGYKWGQLS